MTGVWIALALLCWPVPSAAARLRHLTADGGRSRRGIDRWADRVDGAPPATAVMVAVLLFPVAGVAVGVAAALVVFTGLGQWRARRHSARRVTAMAGFARALGMLAAELRAGADPATAAEGAAADADPVTASVLRSVAASARLGGDVAESLHSQGADHPGIGHALDRVGRAWSLAQRTGIGLAEPLDSVRADIEHRVRFSRSVAARMAGPRASAMILGALPALGVVMGELIGARPWRVLTTQPTGQVLLVVGVTLICGGLAWSRRLTDGVVA